MRLRPLHGFVIALILLGGFSFTPGGLSRGPSDGRVSGRACGSCVAFLISAFSRALLPKNRSSITPAPITVKLTTASSLTAGTKPTRIALRRHRQAHRPRRPASAMRASAFTGPMTWAAGWLTTATMGLITASATGLSMRPQMPTASCMPAGADPQNHTTALGIYVQLHHSNGYITSYGHMSAIAEQACATDGCANIAHGEMLGISGTTGNSTGPHLHFQLTAPNGKSVDPYGWGGSGTDPWPFNQPESLWVMYPSMVFYWYSRPAYRQCGSFLIRPLLRRASWWMIPVRASSKLPTMCWNDINVSNGQAQNNNMSYSKPRLTGPTCTGQWQFPSTQRRACMRFISASLRCMPPPKARSIPIQHAGRSDHVTINQAVFPNNFYVTDGWVYIGKYNFDGAGYRIYSTDESDPGRIGGGEHAPGRRGRGAFRLPGNRHPHPAACHPDPHLYARRSRTTPTVTTDARRLR